MTPHPFREALDRYERAIERLPGALSTWDGRRRAEAQYAYDKARQEVERLYAARVGEEYEVQTVRPEEFNVWEDGTREYYPDLAVRGPNPLKVEHGDRVYVTKGEAG